MSIRPTWILAVAAVALVVSTTAAVRGVDDDEAAIRATIQHYFDEQMLHMPQVALREAEREIHRTADITLSMIQLGRTALLEHDVETANKVLVLEDEVDDSEAPRHGVV